MAPPRYSGDSVTERSKGSRRVGGQDPLGAHEAGRDGDRGHPRARAGRGPWRRRSARCTPWPRRRSRCRGRRRGPRRSCRPPARPRPAAAPRGALVSMRRPDAGAEHRVPALLQRLLPERRGEGGAVVCVVAAPRVVDEHVEAAVVGGDARDERARPAPRSVWSHTTRDPGAAARGHRVGGVLDGARQVLGARARARRAPGDVDGGAALAEDGGDGSAGAAAGAGDEGDAVGEVGHGCNTKRRFRNGRPPAHPLRRRAPGRHLPRRRAPSGPRA